MTDNGGPAAPLPGTPRHHGAGAAIDDLICSLEKEWKVGLKTRGAEWSPQKSNVGDTPDKICALVKYLFFRARPALDDAIREFEGLARRRTREDRLVLLHQILSRKKESQPVPRGRTPKNEPRTGLAASFSGRYTLAFYVLHNFRVRIRYVGRLYSNLAK
jgi:hypothetical protein